MRRLLLVASTIAATTVLPMRANAQADRPTYRSLRDARPRMPDELDRPRRARRVSHRGWEVRSDHFVVVATTSAAHAERVVLELEETWHQFGRLADAWTDVHRRPNFAIGAVGVFIHEEIIDSRREPASGPRTLDHEANVTISLASGEPTLDDQLPRIRSEAVRAFLRVTGQDAVLPEWVIDGLATHFASRDPVTAGGTPGTTSLPRAGVRLPQRITADRMEAPAPGRTSALSVRFLLEANDALYAPTLLAALADSARQDLPVDPDVVRRVGSGNSTRGFERSASWNSRWQITRLIGGADFRGEFERWQSDALVGQPIFDPADIDDPRLLGHARRMMLILKLARRFDGQTTGNRNAATGPLPTRRTPQTNKALVDSPSALDLESLYRRLTAPATEPWATIDIDGTLLWSGNRARIDEIFHAANVRYTTHLRSDQRVLQARLESGELLEAWLERNDENPTRPFARVRLVNKWSGPA